MSPVTHDAAALILQLARESDATDRREPDLRRSGPIPLLLRAQEYGPEAEEAGSAVLVHAGLTLADMDARLVCSLVQFGLDQGPVSAPVTSYARFAGPSRRTISRRLQELGLPTPGQLIRIGVCLRIARGLERTEKGWGRCISVARRVGFSDGATMSNYLHHAIGARPSLLREARPVAIAARFLVHGGAG